MSASDSQLGSITQTGAPMKRARAVQLAMLPKAPSIPGLDIFAFSKPCEAVGGDFYDFISVGPYELGIVIGDVSGHGIDAALVMAAAKKCIHICAEGRPSPRETLLVASEYLAPELPPNSFISVFYAVLDLRRGLLTYAIAGHNPPLLANSAREPRVLALPGKGIVFGASLSLALEEKLTEQQVELEPGDTLLLYTDGLAETADADGELYGEGRIREHVGRFVGQPVQQVSSGLIEDVTRFRGSTRVEDDLTLVALRFLEKAQQNARLPFSRGKSSALTNLRNTPSSFVGRQQELEEVQKLLSEQSPLVTLTGAAGIGKTRLAQVVGRQVLSRYASGVWFVDLSAATSLHDVCAAVAGALGISFSHSDDPVQAVASALSYRKPLLLILDNFEQVRDHAAATVQAWRSSTPNLSVLATSREKLALHGEREVRLAPLGVPEPQTGKVTPTETLAGFDAVRLFVARASEVQAAFRFEGRSAELTSAICTKLQGVPLALELAAARLRDASLEKILEQLRKPAGQLRTLKAPGRESVPRQQTMQAAIAWSFNLLSEWEQSAFTQLCIFEGGFFLGAAEAVLDLGAYKDAPDAVAAVQSLFDKSLLVGDDIAYGRRFRMLASVREFGLAQLAAAPDAFRRALRVRFVLYFAHLAHSLYWCKGINESIESYDMYELESENLRVAQEDAEFFNEGEAAGRIALSRAIWLAFQGRRPDGAAALRSALKQQSTETTRLRLCILYGHIMPEFGANSDVDEFVARTVKEAAASGDAELYAEALMTRGRRLRAQGELAAATSDMEQACKLLDRPLNVNIIAGALTELARCLFSQAKFLPALEYVDRACALDQGTLCADVKGTILLTRGNILRLLSRNEEALVCLEQAGALFARIKSRGDQAVTMVSRGLAEDALGRLDEAMEYFNQAEAILRETGDRAGVARIMGNRGFVWWLLGDFPAARRCGDEALKIARTLNDRQNIAGIKSLLGRIDLAEGNYAAALAHFRDSGTIWNDRQNTRNTATDLAFESLALLGQGEPEEAAEAAGEGLSIVKKAGDPSEEVMLLLTACLAKVEHALGHKEKSRALVASAEEIAQRRGLDEYSSIMNVHAAWQVLNELRAPAKDATGVELIKVRCKDCGRKMAGPRYKFERQKACPHCRAKPFAYVVVSGPPKPL